MKITLEFPLNEGANVLEIFGTTKEEVERYCEAWLDDPENNIPVALARDLENGALTGPVAMYLLQVGLKNVAEPVYIRRRIRAQS